MSQQQATATTETVDASRAAVATGMGRESMRTPAYLALMLLGAAVAVLAWAPWHGTNLLGDGNAGLASTVRGVDIPGWGDAAVVLGILIAALGLLGYFWNPFSDPEALFIALAAVAGLIAAIYRVVDVRSWEYPTGEFEQGAFGVGNGLWLTVACLGATLLGALAILSSRGRAERSSF